MRDLDGSDYSYEESEHIRDNQKLTRGMNRRTYWTIARYFLPKEILDELVYLDLLELFSCTKTASTASFCHLIKGRVAALDSTFPLPWPVRSPNFICGYDKNCAHGYCHSAYSNNNLTPPMLGRGLHGQHPNTTLHTFSVQSEVWAY
jgi:hypothetical protein